METVTQYHAQNEEESPRKPLSKGERLVYEAVQGGNTCGDYFSSEDRAAIRSLVRRGYIGSCSVAGCRVRHYYIWAEDA